MIQTVGSPALLVLFIAFILVMLALDLGLFNRRAHEMTTKEAGVWTGVWIALAMAFNVWVAFRFGVDVGESFLELTDIVFAIDSILAIFAVTADPFIVFTSSVFAVLGMRLSGPRHMARRFDYLQPGLAVILLFVGTKMAISPFFEIPVAVSLAVVVTLLAGSILASIVKTRRQQHRAEA